MSQTLSASTLLVVPLAPLAGALLAGIFGTAFGGNVIGRRVSHTLTILGVFVAFVLSALTLKSVAMEGATLVTRCETANGFARQHGAHGHAPTQALAQRQDEENKKTRLLIRCIEKGLPDHA